MKKLLVICVFFTGSFVSNGQTSAGMYSGKWEENEHAHHMPAMKESNEFINAEMEVKDGIAIFSGLPELKKTYAAVVTNGDGEFVKQKKISPQSNEMSVQSLRRGLYFVTIRYKEKGKKTFVLNL